MLPILSMATLHIFGLSPEGIVPSMVHVKGISMSMEGRSV